MNEYMKPGDKIFVAGHRGLVGSALVRRLQADGFTNLILRTRAELDLMNQKAVDDFFSVEKPDFVFLALPKLVVFMPTTLIQPTLFIKTYRSKRM
jgi:GDP-L-fucose synthase